MIVLDKKYTASLLSIRDIHTDLRASLTRLGYSDEAQDPFMLSASEIFTNALKHTHTLPSSFKVRLGLQGAEMLFTLMDDGEAFKNFETMHQTSEEQNVKFKDGVLSTGGIGLFLSGRDFDNFTYDSINNWNHYRFSSPSPLSIKKPLVLIIDDDPMQRDLITLYLAENYTVQHAGSGKTAIALLKETDKKPNLILCDVIMSDGNGVEFCSALQTDKTLALIPFIFMTGTPQNSAAKTAENLPANGFLQKPVQKDNLLKTIKRVIHKTEQDQRLLGDKLDDEMTSILAPSLPETMFPYKIALKWQSAEAGGGDTAQHYSSENCDHIIIMDIMGHGTQAKFFSHSFAGYLHGFLSAHKNIDDPAEILTALSHFLHTDKIGEKTFLTAQIITFFKDGSLKIVSAGHPPPLLCENNTIKELEIEGPMPGLSPDTTYESTTLSLTPGQQLILYTDGLMEVGKSAKAMDDHKKEMFEIIRTTQTEELTSGAQKVWDSFLGITASSPQDDALLIMLQRD